MNLEELEAHRDLAMEDKADLFDFYHKNWDRLICELKELQAYKDGAEQLFGEQTPLEQSLPLQSEPTTK